MAGGKETPRQKMIGMMYLVLTALLALQIKDEVLDKVVLMESGLEVSNASLLDYNETILVDIQTSVRNQGDKDGDLSVGFGYSEDVNNYNVTWQATPWLETTLRFSDHADANQGIDKGIDVKLRLMKEGKYKPALAIGLQDMLGDGVFSSEYIVASKKIYDFDITMGFGFGNIFRIPFRDRRVRFINSGQIT